MDEEFRRIVATALNIPTSEVRDDLTPETAKSWNSLAMVEMIGGIEKRYKIEIDIDDLIQFVSIGQIRNLLRLKGIVA